MAVREGERLRCGRLRLLVPHLPVDHRGESVLRVALHVLPDVQHRAAGGIDHHTPDVGEALHLGRRHAERRQHHHVVGAERRTCLVGVAQELDALAAEAIVDVRVVDDFARQEHAAIGKSLARLIGIVDSAIDAVAETKFAREMDRETAGPKLKVVGLNLLNEIAVVVLIQLGRDRIFQVEAFAEHERRASFPNVTHFADFERGRHDIDRAQVGTHFAHARTDERFVDIHEELIVGRGLHRQRGGRLRLLNRLIDDPDLTIHGEPKEHTRGKACGCGTSDPASCRAEQAIDAGVRGHTMMRECHDFGRMIVTLDAAHDAIALVVKPFGGERGVGFATAASCICCSERTSSSKRALHGRHTARCRLSPASTQVSISWSSLKCVVTVRVPEVDDAVVKSHDAVLP